MNPEVEKFLREPVDSFDEALRLLARIIGALDAGTALGLTALSLLSSSDPALTGLGICLPWLVAALFLLTAVPGLLLARRGLRPRIAVALVGAFPLAFMVIYGVLLMLPG
ncbi:MAG TPA: hypothetical protein VHY35_22630 [Stellaceae bacterium]|jgi:hypothetical protein|nr:hypothetical protein [Stellaceae bacterium]